MTAKLRIQKVRRNTWGNLNAYIGTLKVKEFGLDAVAAAEWAINNDAGIYDGEGEVQRWRETIMRNKYDTSGA